MDVTEAYQQSSIASSISKHNVELTCDNKNYSWKLIMCDIYIYHSLDLQNCDDERRNDFWAALDNPDIIWATQSEIRAQSSDSGSNNILQNRLDLYFLSILLLSISARGNNVSGSQTKWATCSRRSIYMMLTASKSKISHYWALRSHIPIVIWQLDIGIMHY